MILRRCDASEELGFRFRRFRRISGCREHELFDDVTDNRMDFVLLGNQNKFVFDYDPSLNRFQGWGMRVKLNSHVIQH